MSLFISHSMPAFRDYQDDNDNLLSLDEGYTAEVYVTKVNGRRQLVKKLKPEFASDQRFIDLFRKEYELGSSLNHPNLVVYRQFAQSADGVMLMLDYIDGLTLQEILDTAPDFFTINENIVKFVNQLLSCIAYLHEHQVLHLDIKPSNIMITHLNADVKVIDLGFSYSDTYVDTPGLSSAYAAPEQKDKTQHSLIDVRTDLYAVGRVIEDIETATGKKLPQAYHRLMTSCLEADMDKRPASAKAALKMVRPAKKAVRILSGIIIAMILVVAGLFAHPTTRKPILYAFSSMSRYDVYRPTGDHFRVLSEEDATCELVDWQPTSLTDKESWNSVIYPVEEINGKMYRVTTIADKAYVKNKYLRSIYIPEGVEHIGNSVAAECRNLSSLHLPNTVKTIGIMAFTRCPKLQSVVLSSGLKEIPEGAFAICDLTHIRVPEGVEILCKDCFAKNKNLKDVSLPKSLKKIDRGVFYKCESLVEITIPENVTKMGDYVFLGCSKLTDVYNLATVPQDANELFNSPKVRVHVPAASLEAYKKHPVWGQQVLVPIEN